MKPDITVLSILVGYMEQQLKIIKELSEKIFSSSKELSSEKDTYYVALLLHNLYNAFEDLFREVARTFENHEEDPSRYHRELLKKMAIEVPSIRPPLLSSRSLDVLDRLRRFRHFVRHAYNYEIDAEELLHIVKTLEGSFSSILKDIRDFQTWLETVVRGISSHPSESDEATEDRNNH